MYNFEAELDTLCKETSKRWNGKVITTAKQWNYNDGGSESIGYCTMERIMECAKYTIEQESYNF